MEKMYDKRSNIIEYVMLIVIFGGLLFFYLSAHPLFIYDSDDWTYISFHRQALPSIQQWNPTKVLPETLMPLIAELGVRFIYPISGDYISALATVFALAISLIITIYIYISIKMVKERYCICGYSVAMLGIAYLLYHFWVYLVSDVNNTYFFYGGNVNCYFNYIIPGLFNAIFVLYCISKNDDYMDFRVEQRNSLKIGFIILWIYLCICSNMFHSIILVSYLASKLVYEVVLKLINKDKLIDACIKVIINSISEIVIIIGWLICILIESQGARAQWAAGTTLTNLPIAQTILLFIESIKSMNRTWLLVTIFINVCALIICIFNLNKNKADIKDSIFLRDYIKIIISFGITVLYLILLCAKVTPSYIKNNTVMISWVLWVMILTFLSIGYILSKYTILNSLLPFLVYLLVFNTVIDGKTFAENNVVWNYNVEVVKQLDEYFIEQIKEADKRNMEYAEILIPVSDSAYWPLDVTYSGNRISTTLFRHGLISRQIEVMVIPDYSVNEKYNLEIYTMPQ